MNFDNYVRYMTQKYRLAAAIAVLKVKPANLSVEEYINELNNKISDNNMETDFLDISLGSDDFNIDEDDIMINDNNFKDNAERESLNDSVTILKDINMDVESNENAGHEADSFENMISLLKDFDENVETASKTVATDNMTQITFCESLQTQSIDLTAALNENYIDPDIDFYHTQMNETQDLIFVDTRSAAATSVVKLNQDKIDNSNRSYFGNYEVNSETYSDNMKVTQNLEKTNHKQKTMAENVLKNISEEAKIKLVNRTETDTVNNEHINIRNPVNQTTESQSIIEDDNILIGTQVVERNSDMVNKVCQNLQNVNQNTMSDSQSTILYSWYGNTQNFTHVSQSQYDDLKIHDNFIHGSKTDRHKPQLQGNSENIIGNNFDGHDLADDQMSGNGHITRAPQMIDVDSSEIQYVIDKSGRTYRVLEGFRKEEKTAVTNKILNTNTNMHGSNNINNDQNVASQELFASNDIGSQNDAISLDQPVVANKIYESNDKTEEENQNFEMTLDFNDDNLFDDDATASQKEVIPFKVIEELNKIKTFLNRKMDRRASTDSYSTDSGYRSDSQSKSSYKSALQLTGNALNQSAHCMYSYVLQCPLVGSTEDITLEMAAVLGKLIDKLHESEKYPSFLEDILDSIDSLLKDVSEGENSSDNIILTTKDESIQRFLLLNKSSHVIQYSIDKITSILDKLHTYLTNKDNLYELTNIDITENICYVFHILEILIKRYRKTQKDDTSSQNSTQYSQDSEGILKKSSITDIWRRKWNPDYKNVKIEGSSDKKCVLKKSGEILNKVIVDCMEGYSLVSYAALQCFNLLQS